MMGSMLCEEREGEDVRGIRAMKQNYRLHKILSKEGASHFSRSRQTNHYWVQSIASL